MFAILTLLVLQAISCPFCPPSTPPLASRVADSDVVLLATWVKLDVKSEDQAETFFSAIDVIKSPEKEPRKKGDQVMLPFARQGQVGDLLLLMGKKGEKGIDWLAPIEVTETSYQYVRRAPPPEATVATRLEYFVKYLNHADNAISTDAFSEFSQADYKDVARFSASARREDVRKWIEDLSNATLPRRGLYGLMLGHCGNQEDAKDLEAEILRDPEPDEVRIGLDGMIAGYLLLAGPEGLTKIEEKKLKGASIDRGEAIAVLNALRFFVDYQVAVIPPVRVHQSARLLLDQPDLAEIVTRDLARWKVWDIVDLLSKQYAETPWEGHSIRTKASIIRYMQACVKDAPKDRDLEGSFLAASKFLERVPEKDLARIKFIRN